jgi:citrate synthase
MPAPDITKPAVRNGTANGNGVKSENDNHPILHVVDSRTGQYYPIPIVRNAISASAFKQVKAPEDTEHPEDQTDQGIRVFDPGFSNTAVSESQITFMYVY